MPIPSSDFHIGRLALERGFVTPAQVETALAEQAGDVAAGRPARPLGAILVAKGFLADHQLTLLLGKFEGAGAGPSDPLDTLLGDLLVRQGRLSPQHLQECLEAQAAAPRDAAGKPPRLGELLILKGYATADAIRQALAGQRKVILACAACGKRYNVRDVATGKQYRCPACRALLAVSASPDAVQVDESAVLEPTSFQPAVQAPSSASPVAPPAATVPAAPLPASPQGMVAAPPPPSPAPAPPRHHEGRHAHRPRVIVVQKGVPVWGLVLAVLSVAGLVGGGLYLAGRREEQRRVARVDSQEDAPREGGRASVPLVPPGRSEEPSTASGLSVPAPRRPLYSHILVPEEPAASPSAAPAQPTPQAQPASPLNPTPPVAEADDRPATAVPAAPTPAAPAADPEADAADVAVHKGQILRLQGPPNAEEADLRKAAKALATRCRGHGYTGIDGDVRARRGRRVIEMTTTTEFTADMRARIARLVTWAAAQAEFRPTREMTEAEQEQFIPKAGEQFKWSFSPAGSQWVRCIGSAEAPMLYTQNGERVMLLKKYPVIPLAKASALTSVGGYGLGYELDKDGTEAKHLSPNTSVRMLVDGFALEDVCGSVAFEEPEEPAEEDDKVNCPVCRGAGSVETTVLDFGQGGGVRRGSKRCTRCDGAGHVTIQKKGRGNERRVLIVLSGLSQDLLLMLRNPMPFYLTEEGLPPPPLLPVKPAAAPPKLPAPKPAASPDPEPEKECEIWFNLAQNFYNQRNFDKTEMYVARILEKCPSGKTAAKARELLEKVKLLR